MTKLPKFLYLLMRDHVPTGVIAKLLVDVGELDPDTEPNDYSNDHLMALAEDYASCIIDD